MYMCMCISLLTVNVPRAKTRQSIIFFFLGSCDCINTGMGKRIIMKSEEMLSTAFVIRWFVAAEHWTGNLNLISIVR